MEEGEERREARVKEEGKRGTKKKKSLTGGKEKRNEKKYVGEGGRYSGGDMDEERKRER